MQSNLTVKVGADIAELQKGLKGAQNHLSSFQRDVAKAGTYLAATFSIGAIASFGKAVLDTTAKFQKFEAVLTNTLGSKSGAQQALAQITEFASKTPFQVDELTGSFVKLVNQGFKPTMKEMTSLGDIAASQGKSFDQLTEAIIDAQTGEFERLKEFGIRASKAGDKVMFTFKGVKQQVDFTSESIREYILSLGNAAGVTGSMEAISKTLGGQISNLEDAFEQFKLALGQTAEEGGNVSAAIDGITKAIQGLTTFVKSDTFDKILGAAWDQMSLGAKTYMFILDAMKKQIKETKATELRRLRDELALAQGDWEAWQETGLGNRNKIAQKIADLSAQIRNFPTTEDPLPWATEEKVEKIDAATLALGRLRSAIKFQKPSTTPEDPGYGMDPDEDAMIEAMKKWSDRESENPVPGIVAETDANNDLTVSLYELAEARDKEIKKEQEHAEQMQHNMAVAQSLGGVIGEAFGEAVTGQKKFGDAMKAMLPQIIKMLLTEAMASIVAAGAKQGAKSGNAIVGVVAATAGAAAIGSLFSKAVNSGAATGISNVSSVGQAQRGSNVGDTQVVKVEVGDIIIDGNKLRIVMQRTDEGNKIRKS